MQFPTGFGSHASGSGSVQGQQPSRVRQMAQGLERGLAGVVNGGLSIPAPSSNQRVQARPAPASSASSRNTHLAQQASAQKGPPVNRVAEVEQSPEAKIYGLLTNVRDGVFVDPIEIKRDAHAVVKEVVTTARELLDMVAPVGIDPNAIKERIGNLQHTLDYYLGITEQQYEIYERDSLETSDPGRIKKLQNVQKLIREIQKKFEDEFNELIINSANFL